MRSRQTYRSNTTGETIVAKPNDHYLALFKWGEHNPILITLSDEGYLAVEDPEDPPPGLCLPAAVELADAARKEIKIKDLRKTVIIMQRQSTGTYFPIAHVMNRAVFLLFDPGAPRLELTREGKKHLKKLGIRLSA
jgi:hypothetical protein